VPLHLDVRLDAELAAVPAAVRHLLALVVDPGPPVTVRGR
jgi:hypothetical protein